MSFIDISFRATLRTTMRLWIAVIGTFIWYKKLSEVSNSMNDTSHKTLNVLHIVAE